jgi:hypothetical protein
VAVAWNPNNDAMWKRRRREKEKGRAMRRADFERLVAESKERPTGA